jgi:hypothetical protein
MSEYYPADRYVQNATGQIIEWRRDLSSPTELFDNERLLARRDDIAPATDFEVPTVPVSRVQDWGELMEGPDNGLHALRAVVNVNEMNIGIAETNVDGRPVTYLTRFADSKDDKSTFLGIIDHSAAEDVSLTFYDLSTRWEGLTNSCVTVTRTREGALRVRNETTERMSIGLAEQPEPAVERFSIKGIMRGIRRVFEGQKQVPRTGRSLITDSNWFHRGGEAEMSINASARWMREHNQAFYAVQSV